ncbi:pH-response regulator protein palF/Rim8p [Monosporozyma unispora]|nr:ph-response sensor protein [Kazachstania unispora]
MTLLNIWKRGSGSGKDEEKVSVSSQESILSAGSNSNNSSAKYSIRQYYLALDEPHRLYKPGETLSGQLVLELKRDMIDLNLDLILCGQIKVKLRNSTGTGLKSMKPLDFLHKQTTLYGKNHPNEHSGLSQGVHKFPFNLKLPSKRKLYNEIKFERGKVEYSLQSTISLLPKPMSNSNITSSSSSTVTTTNSSTLTHCEIPFHIFVPLDVTPYATKHRNKTVVLQSSVPLTLTTSARLRNGSVEDRASSTFTQTSTNSSSFNMLTGGSNNNGDDNENNNDIDQSPKTVRISVSIPQSGFVIGESIPITINLQHYKEYFHSSGVVITLVRICRVGSVESMNMETFRKDVCQTVSPLVVDDSTNYQLNKTIPLRIPQDIFATFTTKRDDLFNFTYYVEVLVNLSRKNQVVTNNNVLLSNSNGSISPTLTRLKPSAHTIEQQSKLLRNKLLPMLLDNDNITMENNGSDTGSMSHPLEDQTIFNDNDMINVETLKRQRNVTGMSIEIVIGNVRNIPILTSLPVSSPLQPPPPQTLENLPSYTPPIDTLQQDLVNESIRRNEDKQDLEHQRLQTMESEPPDMY